LKRIVLLKVTQVNSLAHDDDRGDGGVGDGGVAAGDGGFQKTDL
jgi:hypothetical protein